MDLLEIMMELNTLYCLVLIYDRIRIKSAITYDLSQNDAKIKIYSDDDLPLEETLNLHNVVILIKPVLNQNQNHYYYNIFLEKCSCQLAKK